MAPPANNNPTTTQVETPQNCLLCCFTFPFSGRTVFHFTEEYKGDDNGPPQESKTFFSSPEAKTYYSEVRYEHTKITKQERDDTSSFETKSETSFPITTSKVTKIFHSHHKLISCFSFDQRVHGSQEDETKL